MNGTALSFGCLFLTNSPKQNKPKRGPYVYPAMSNKVFISESLWNGLNRMIMAKYNIANAICVIFLILVICQLAHKVSVTPVL